MHPDGCFWWQLYFGNFPEWLLLRDSCKDWYQENCPAEDYPPENPSPPKKKIAPYGNSPLWIFPPMKASPCRNYPPRIFPPRKSPPGKITPNEISSLLINHPNERKNKITKFFTLKKAVQYNILIKIAKILFATQMISQKILGLDTFFIEWKKSKNRTKAKIAKCIYLPVAQVKEN